MDTRSTITIPATDLKFKPLTPADIPAISQLLQQHTTRSCDTTVGGIFLWIDYFDYSFAIAGDTLYIRGVAENNVKLPAFSVPIGPRPLEQSIEALRLYCADHGEPLRFSAVPEEMLPALQAIEGAQVEELTDFADYIYDIRSLASMAGKHLAKKRNHINRFLDENPDYEFIKVTDENIDRVKEFYSRLPHIKDSASATYEALTAARLLDNLHAYPFEAWALSTPAHGIVALSIAEVKGDTLHIHVEKMNHNVDGAGEMIVKLMAAKMLELYPHLQYENRQDDAGDPGLRQAKQSYRPAMLLRKYNVTIS